MKSRLLAIALFAVIVGLGACGGKDKSNKCDLTNFKDPAHPTVVWAISGTDITATFSKGSNVTNLAPTFDISLKATVDPPSGTPRNFSSPVTYKVTAEDKKASKTYTVRVTVANE